MRPQLEEHFFRREFSRLVAILVRRVGLHHMETVEDSVQSALLVALETWKGCPPDNPSAWLYRVAYHNLLEALRTRGRHERLLGQRHVGSEETDQPESPSGEERNDLLQMMFVCCDTSIPVESQLVLTLKTLCGFEIDEIAQRLFTTQGNVYKRLGRARSRLRELSLETAELSAEQLVARLPAIHAVLYLLFTEGYLSGSGPAIRRELCEEAKRLALLLVDHAIATPETSALLALMHLHIARNQSRHTHSAGLLLLEEQDRTQWDQREIQTGLFWLAESARGETFSRYHAEAGIAAEHCLAPSFDQTRWERIVECYDLLERLAPSALHRLNRAVAVAQWRGPAEGLAVVQAEVPPAWLQGSYMWSAVLSDLHRRCGHAELAQHHRNAAIAAAPSDAVRQLLARRLQRSDDRESPQ